MAKVGEGDERWIVKEREDGANVNGWHWSEKNLTEWAKERLTELLSDIVVLDDSTGSCKVCKVEKMVGDVTVQARKQKKFPLYELEITLNWEGQLFDAEARSTLTPPRVWGLQYISHTYTHTRACERRDGLQYLFIPWPPRCRRYPRAARTRPAPRRAPSVRWAPSRGAPWGRGPRRRPSAASPACPRARLR